MNTKTTYKRTISFLDADRKKATINVKVTTRNGYPEFTASGEYCGSLGQCLGDIKPATPEQKKLIDTWENWHLNGISAGTDNQNEIAKGLSYDDAVKKLTGAGLLYDSHPETGDPYKYGSGWIVKQLPDNFINDLDLLIDEIKQQEEERTGDPLYNRFGSDGEIIELIKEKTGYAGRDAELCAALCKMFDLSEHDLSDIDINGTRVTVQGNDYLAGNDDEMNEAWDEDLENYIDECLEIPAHIERYFDREAWKEDARQDGRGHSLNRYDGGEEEAEVNDVYYFAYRQ